MEMLSHRRRSHLLSANSTRWYERARKRLLAHPLEEPTGSVRLGLLRLFLEYVGNRHQAIQGACAALRDPDVQYIGSRGHCGGDVMAGIVPELGERQTGAAIPIAVDV